MHDDGCDMRECKRNALKKLDGCEDGSEVIRGMEATSQEKIEHSVHLFAPYHKWNQVSDNSVVSVGLDQHQQRTKC
jgi:hypothetical protein